MESQSISLGDLFSVELFVGSITFVLGTVLFFLLLLLNLRLNLKTTLLYCCLQLILVVSLSTIFFIFWRFNFDIMIGFLYLPGVLSEVFIMLLPLCPILFSLNGPEAGVGVPGTASGNISMPTERHC